MKKISLSPYQYHLWLEWKLNPSGTEYNTPLIYRIEGQLDIPALEKALSILINQYYDATRCYVVESAAGPLQIILDSIEVNLELKECKSTISNEKVLEQDHIQYHLEELINHIFDLSAPPLFKFTLLKIEDEIEKFHILVLNFHHIISDAQTAVLLTEILSTLYNNLVDPRLRGDDNYNLRREDKSNSILLRSFSEAIQLQQQNYTDAKQKIDLEYWQKKLQDKALSVDFHACQRQASIQQRFQQQNGDKNDKQSDKKIDKQSAGIVYFILENQHALSLKKFAKDQRSTLFLVLSALFSCLLHRYTQQKSIILTYPINMRPQGFPVMGSFVNMIPSVVEFAEESTFISILKTVTENRKEAKAHQQITLTEVMKSLQKQRSVTASDFNVGIGEAFLFSSPLVLNNLKVTSIQPSTRRAFNDLYLYYEPKDNGAIECRFDYKTALFTSDFMNTFTEIFINMLHALAQDPSLKISQFNLLTDEAIQKIMQWGNYNHNNIYLPLEAGDLQTLTIHKLFELQVEKTPNLIAIQYSKQSMTYAELNNASNQLADQIQKEIQIKETMQTLDSKKETSQISKVIGIYLPRGIEQCIAILGILKAGYAYLPLDIEDGLQRSSEIIQDANIDLLITNQSTSKQSVSFLDVSTLQISQFTDTSSPRRRGSSDRERSANSWIPACAGMTSVDANQLAYIMYTSGTTGKPKGVMIEHKSIINLIQDAIKVFQIAPSTRDKPYTILSLTSTTFDIYGLELYAALWTGATHIICPDNIRHDPQKLAQAILELKPNLIQATPTLWSLLLTGFQQLNSKNLLNTGNSLSSLNFHCTFLSGGEALSSHLAEQLLSLVGPLGQVWNVYGPTETTIWSTYYQVKQSDTSSASGTVNELSLNPESPPCIGKPFMNTSLYVLDKYQQFVPIGVKGELYIGGIGLSPGYINNQTETDKNFTVLPHLNDFFGHKYITNKDILNDSHICLYKTGDFVHWTEEGNLVYLGREDEQIKIRGHRIELAGIEQVFKSHPELTQVIVKYIDDKLVLFYIKKKLKFLRNLYKNCYNWVANFFENSISMNISLKQLANKHLSKTMQPTVFIELETIPVDSHGKLDNAQLKAHFNSFHLSPLGEGKYSDYRAYDIIEFEIKNAWCQVLALSDVDLDQMFTDAGGDSLSVVHLSLFLSDRFKKPYSVSWIYQYNTILKQAQFIREHSEIQSIYQPIVKLNNAIHFVKNDDETENSPLFLIHPALGGVEAYDGLARCLPHIPIYAFDSVNLNSGLPLKNSIEDLALYYIEHLRKVKPNGPYILGGWSLGGMIAFEMAHILKQQKETIEQLYLLDTQIYRGDYLKNTYDLFEMEDVIQHLPPGWANHFKNIPKNQLENTYQSFKQDIFLLRNYIIKPFAGSATLFKSTKKTNLSQGLTNTKHNGWKPYINNLEIINIDCTHYNLIKGEAIQKVASKIRKAYI